MNWLWQNLYLNKENRQTTRTFLFLVLLFVIGKASIIILKQPNNTKPKEFNFVYVQLEEDTTTAQLGKEVKKEEPQPKNSSKNLSPEKSTKSGNSDEGTIKTKLFEFDPNTLSKDSLLLLGINKYAVQNLIKYREKGGKIEKPEDLKKIYGINEEIFERLENSIKIIIPEKPKKEMPNYPKKKEIVTQREIEINSADTTDWKQLKGIGPYYAKQIMNYRAHLGGFVSVDQVREVYQLPDSTFQKIKPFLYVDASKVLKRNLNDLSLEDLYKHPYIDYTNAKHIINYRNTHGQYKTMNELNKLYGLKPTVIDTINLYFTIK